MIIDHGHFTLYKPQLPEGHPLKGTNTMFIKNGQGRCWYSIAHAEPEPGRTFVALQGDRVCSLAQDPSTLWPIDCRLLETDEPVEREWIFNGAGFEPPPPEEPKPQVESDLRGELADQIAETFNAMQAEFDRKAEQIRADTDRRILCTLEAISVVSRAQAQEPIDLGAVPALASELRERGLPVDEENIIKAADKHAARIYQRTAA